MARDEKLLTLIRKAETNGFDLQRWYLDHIATESHFDSGNGRPDFRIDFFS